MNKTVSEEKRDVGARVDICPYRSPWQALAFGAGVLVQGVRRSKSRGQSRDGGRVGVVSFTPARPYVRPRMKPPACGVVAISICS